MALTPMYDGKSNSPKTTLSAAITANDTTIPVTLASVFPTAPNFATIGNDENAEVIFYTGISGNSLTGCTRGYNSETTASGWDAGTEISRQITKYDFDAIKRNILDLESRKIEGIDWGDIGGDIDDQTDLGTALAAKAPLASPAFTGTPTSPTAAASANDTQLATTAFVHKRGLFHVSITVAGAGTVKSYADENITATMRVVNCVFGTPANAPGKFTVVTAAGVITFTGTFLGSTTIDVDLMESDDVTATGV